MPSPRRIVFLVAIAVGVALFGSGCSSGGSGAQSTQTTQFAPAVLIKPDAFAERVGDPAVVTVNVHTPNEGNITGTDLAIPFDQIGESNQLPADRSTPLAVYCRSGNMSADAVKTLSSMGYDNIVELEGGYNGWIASGRTLEPGPP
jgi:rhodanese-related sulfurtransferase